MAFYLTRHNENGRHIPLSCFGAIAPIVTMDAFAQFPPTWITDALHAQPFGCPSCGQGSREAKQVWLNRRAPVFTEGHKRKWQEFYQCECNTVWWGWSSDRPPLDLSKKSDNSDADLND